jgi:hypothetical protein
MQRSFDADMRIERIYFHSNSDVLILISNAGVVLLIDLASGVRREFDISSTRDGIPCIAQDPHEPTPLVSLLTFEPIHQLLQNGLGPHSLIVPDENYVGVSSSRFHMFGNMAFDEVTQQALLSEAIGSKFTIAASKPRMAISHYENPEVSVFDIAVDPRTNEPTLRDAKKVDIGGISGISQLQLSDDGSLIYWSSAATGSGGFGRRLTGVTEVETGVQRWAASFEGHMVFSAHQSYIARSSIDGKTGLIVSDFYNGHTSERLFSVPGIAVAFDPLNCMALVEDPNGRAGEAIKLRLVEVTTVTSFANDGNWPDILMGYRCDMGAMPFRSLANRTDRIWNKWDWHRVDVALGSLEKQSKSDGRQKPLRLWCRNNEVQVSDSLEGPADVVVTPTQAKRRYKLLVDLIEEGVELVATEFSTSNSKLLGLIKRAWREPNWQMSWEIYNVSDDRLTLIESGPLPDGVRHASPGIFFIDPRDPAAIVHQDKCTLGVLRLADKTSIGTLRPAFDSPVAIQQIRDDLIAVHSAGKHGYPASIQIFDYPDLNPGPWLMPGGEVEMEETPGALVPFGGGMAFELVDDGELLVVRQQDQEPTVLSVPPWGRRLRELLDTQERSAQSSSALAAGGAEVAAGRPRATMAEVTPRRPARSARSNEARSRAEALGWPLGGGRAPPATSMSLGASNSAGSNAVEEKAPAPTVRPSWSVRIGMALLVVVLVVSALFILGHIHFLRIVEQLGWEAQ